MNSSNEFLMNPQKQFWRVYLTRRCCSFLLFMLKEDISFSESILRASVVNAAHQHLENTAGGMVKGLALRASVTEVRTGYL